MHEGGGDNKSKPGKGRRELSQSLILKPYFFFPGKNHGYFFLVSFSYFSKITIFEYFSIIILMDCGSFQFRSPVFLPYFHYLGNGNLKNSFVFVI